MKILLPEQPSVKLRVGDIMKSPYDNNGDVYILSKIDDKYVWYKPCGAFANGRHDSLEAFQNASQKYIEDSRYSIFSMKDYDLKLIPKVGK